MRKIGIAGVLVLALASSCNIGNNKTITGNGVIVTRDYNISDFKDIDVSSSLHVTLVQADSFQVKMDGEDNILSSFEVKLVGEKLVVKPRENRNLNYSRPLNLYVTAPAFRKLEASGACKLESGSMLRYDEKIELDMSGSCNARLAVEAAEVLADVSGACEISLSGKVKKFKVDGSGSSKVRCFDLAADKVDIDFSGAGVAEVNAAQELKLDISGAARISYKGNPAITQEVSGAASVKKAE